MLEPVMDFFEKLVVDFSWKRLLLVSVLGSFALLAWIYESYTDSFQLARLNKQLLLLENLAKLKSSGQIDRFPELSEIYIGLTNSVQSLSKQSINQLILSRSSVQALTAGAPWFLLAIAMLVFERDKNGKDATIGIIVASTPVVVIGYCRATASKHVKYQRTTTLTV